MLPTAQRLTPQVTLEVVTRVIVQLHELVQRASRMKDKPTLSVGGVAGRRLSTHSGGVDPGGRCAVTTRPGRRLVQDTVPVPGTPGADDACHTSGSSGGSDFRGTAVTISTLMLRSIGRMLWRPMSPCLSMPEAN